MTLFTFGYGHSAGGGRFMPRPWHYRWGVFDLTRQLAKFSPANMPYILNLFRISLCVEAVKYRPYASASFKVASHVKKTAISAIIFLIY